MGQHGPFGVAGSTRRVKDAEVVIGIDGGFRSRSVFCSTS